MKDVPNFAAYRDLVQRYFKDDVKGKANPYTSMNGNMYSFLDKSGTVCLRMPEDDRKRYADEFGTGPVIQYGSVMKEYVSVPEDRLMDMVAMKNACLCCLAYAKSLPAK